MKFLSKLLDTKAHRQREEIIRLTRVNIELLELAQHRGEVLQTIHVHAQNVNTNGTARMLGRMAREGMWLPR